MYISDYFQKYFATWSTNLSSSNNVDYISYEVTYSSIFRIQTYVIVYITSTVPLISGFCAKMWYLTSAISLKPNLLKTVHRSTFLVLQFILQIQWNMSTTTISYIFLNKQPSFGFQKNQKSAVTLPYKILCIQNSYFGWIIREWTLSHFIVTEVCKNISRYLGSATKNNVFSKYQNMVVIQTAIVLKPKIYQISVFCAILEKNVNERI